MSQEAYVKPRINKKTGAVDLALRKKQLSKDTFKKICNMKELKVAFLDDFGTF